MSDVGQHSTLPLCCWKIIRALDDRELPQKIQPAGLLCDLFSQESQLLGVEFVTRHITYRIARIKLGLADMLGLGKINAETRLGADPRIMPNEVVDAPAKLFR